MALYSRCSSRSVFRYFLFVLISLLVIACGGGSDDTNNTNSASNSAPVISGTPGVLVSQDTPYSFLPRYSDKDGNKLTFLIINKPAWASFNSSTGALSGTPTSTHVGTTSGVTISVSDGTATASLPAFDITVVATKTGSASLSWIAPTKYTDNTIMTDLAGYEIHYGISPKNYSKVIKINNPSTTNYTINNLPSGTYYFVMRSITGTSKSAFTPEISKVIIAN